MTAKAKKAGRPKTPTSAKRKKANYTLSPKTRGKLEEVSESTGIPMSTLLDLCVMKAIDIVVAPICTEKTGSHLHALEQDNQERRAN